MNLNDIYTAPRTSVPKINKFLRESGGRFVKAHANSELLENALRQADRELREMEINGLNPSRPRYARMLMVREALDFLLAQNKFFESFNKPGCDIRDRICSKLASYVCKCVNTGDDVEHALNKAMDHYRSCPYRWPDDDVRERVKDMVSQAFECDAFHPRSATLLDDLDLDGLAPNEEWIEDTVGIQDQVWELLEPAVLRQNTPRTIQDAIDASTVPGRTAQEIVDQVNDILMNFEEIE